MSKQYIKMLISTVNFVNENIGESEYDLYESL